MPELIYSRYYSVERFNIVNLPMQIKINRSRAPDYTDKGFIEAAIEFSEKMRMSINIQQNDTHICATFFSGSFVVNEECAPLFEYMVLCADCWELTLPKEINSRIEMRFVRTISKKT